VKAVSIEMVFVIEDTLMPLCAKAITAIQSAGAAVFTADMELQNAVKQYSDQVNVAMLQNPFDVGNDTLYEDWKTLARLSQAIHQIEAELQKIYKVGVELRAAAPSRIATVQALAAPLATGPGFVEVLKEIKATDVIAKRKGKRTTTSLRRRKPVNILRGNTARLMNWLTKALKTDEPVRLNRSAVAIEIGLPNGSIGASFNKLLAAGYIVEQAVGLFTLGSIEVTKV
jgi:hypothetical protein